MDRSTESATIDVRVDGLQHRLLQKMSLKLRLSCQPLQGEISISVTGETLKRSKGM